MQYILDKNGQRIKLKNGSFKSRKNDTIDWNSKEKAEEKSAQKENQSINPIHSVPSRSKRLEQPFTLLELLNTAMQQAEQSNSRYGKIGDLKTFATPRAERTDRQSRKMSPV